MPALVLRLLLRATLAGAIVAAGCTRAPVATAPAPSPAPASTAASAPSELEVVESWPEGTALDHPDIRDASDVWPEMLRRAKSSIDVAQFYASDAEGPRSATSKLRPVIEELVKARARGVQVRFLADASFAKTYPLTLLELAGAGISVRKLDAGKVMGGVLHAKYFVVDGDEAFVGSQNFDWRALAHIQEIGLRMRGPHVSLLTQVFERDWATAGGEPRSNDGPRALVFGASLDGGAEVSLAASPEGHLPAGAPWDLPEIVRRIANAKRSVSVQLLTYATKSRDGSAFTTLDDELRRAAGRGVRVRLLVSHWAERPERPSRASLDALAAVPGVEVRVLEIPPSPDGEIPFARVAHAKYMLVDDADAWVGTSNWEGDYFSRSRNVSVFVRGGEVPAELARVFEDGWSSTYARPLR